MSGLGAMLRRRVQVNLSDRQFLAVLLSVCLLVCVPSLVALAPLAQADTPLSFLPLVPFVGAFFLVRLCDGQAWQRRSHDGFVDGLIAAALAIGAGILFLLLPVTMSWQFWLDRLDIPAAVTLLSTLVVALWGTRALRRLLPGLLYLLLAWPLPLLIADNHILPGLASATAEVSKTLVALLPIRTVAGSGADAIAVRHGAHVVTLTIAAPCAGGNGMLGILVLGLPLAVLAAGTVEARAAWLGLGASLYWAANVGRIVLLAGATAVWGPGPSMALLHPYAGMVIFALSFLAMLALARACGVTLRVLAPGGRAPSRTYSYNRFRASLGTATLVVALLAESNLGAFSWLSNATLPRVSLAEAAGLIAPPPGWRVVAAAPMPSWQTLFGPSTYASVMTLGGPGGRRVDVQAIVTRNSAGFATYGVEDCYEFHGYDLRGVHLTALGNGVTGTLVDFAAGGKHLAALYWIQPVRTPAGQFYQRIILISRSRLVVTPSQPVNGDSSPAQQLGQALAGALSPWVGGDAGVAYATVNESLESLGREVLVQERRG